MLKDFLDWCAGLTAKDILGPLSALIVGALGHHAVRLQLRRKDGDTTETAKVTAEAAQRQAEALTADALTKRFQALMDGYERRISDLTDEVMRLRSEVGELREEIARRERACMGCPNRLEALNAS